jgi:hypothetical protein
VKIVAYKSESTAVPDFPLKISSAKKRINALSKKRGHRT